MTNYNTGSDAANTAVRSFLTKVGEHYLGRSFNTASGKGKADWLRIKDVVFEGKCAYCYTAGVDLQIEHMVMFNRTEFGLHHPGNTIPICKPCNNRKRDKDKKYLNWQDQLKEICAESGNESEFEERKKKILSHIKNEKYPELTPEERNAIRVVSEKLYENIKNQVELSLELYKDLDSAFVKK
jgi:hypothetical protein